MHKSYVVLALIFCHFAGAGAAPAREAEKNSPYGKLVGTWKLVSIAIQYPDGRILPDPGLGPAAKGYLYYDPGGHMCVQLMNPDRFDWRNPGNATPREAKSAIEGYEAYCGTYEVDESDSVVIHHRELSLIPNGMGTSLGRHFVLQGNRLLLRFLSGAQNGQKLGVTLTWERVN